MRLIALVPAGGGGSRFGAGIPKQYADLRGAPVLLRTLERLDAALALDRLYVAVAADDVRCRDVLAPMGGRAVVLPCGGSTRAATVRNALAAIAGACADDDWILVHDAARPCVPRDALQRLVAALRDDAVGGLLALPVADTLKRGSRGEAEVRVAGTEDRNGLWQAQTPQMFRYDVLLRAFAQADIDHVTDEAQAVEALGLTPRIVYGSRTNLKVTFPEDLELVAAILAVEREAARRSA